MKSEYDIVEIQLLTQMLDEIERGLIGASPATAIRVSVSVFSQYMSQNPGLLDVLVSPSHASRLKEKSDVLPSAIFLAISSNHLEYLEKYLHALAEDSLVSASSAVLTPTLMNPDVRNGYINFLNDWEVSGQSSDDERKRKGLVSLEVNHRLREIVFYHVKSGIDPADMAREIVFDLCSKMEYDPEKLAKIALECAISDHGEMSGERSLLMSERAADIIHAALDLGLDVSSPGIWMEEDVGGAVVEDIFSHVLRRRQENAVPDGWTYDPILFLLLDHGADWRPATSSPNTCPKLREILLRHPEIRREFLMKVPSDTTRAPPRVGKLG